MKLLINSTEQVQPDDRNDTVIKLFGRSPDDPTERIEVSVFGFDPYFYVLEDELRQQEQFILSQDATRGIDYCEADPFNDGRTLAKVYPTYPQDTRSLREHFTEHWNADVPFTNRFRIDTGLRAAIEIPDSCRETEVYECHWREIEPLEDPLSDVEPRVFTLDIEVDDRGSTFPADGNERILSIVAHDSYEGETIAFIDESGYDVAYTDPDPDGVDQLRAYEDEYSMLHGFRSHFRECDPDLITGWNVDGFDVPYLIDRMEKCNVSPDRLSPLGWSGRTSRGEPRIKGRTVYDLLTVYKRNSRTELRSYTLDYVAGEELDAEKVEFEGTYYDLYQNDPKKFIEYNAKDVELVVRINEEAGVIKFRDILRRQVGVDFEDSYDNKDFVDMMCRRKLKELGKVGPSRPAYGEAPESDYEGGHVFSAYEGVATSVVGIDLASLYPYTMAMLNASPETKVPEGKPDVRENVARADNGQRFNLSEDGLFKQLVDDAIALKSEYKQLRNNAETEEEYERYDERYTVAKTITNSLYGVTGWERFFLYDEDVAEAVTLTGQAVVKKTAEYIEETGPRVIYGDTDSCYVKFPDEWEQERCLNTARELCTDLNDTIYPEFAEEHGIPREDNLWEIEPEAYMRRFFQAGKKKRYAYLATWKDGHHIEDPEPTIIGFEEKRSDTAALTAEVQQRIFEAIFDDEAERARDIVYEAAQEVTRFKPDWERIGIPGGMNKRIPYLEEHRDKDDYYAMSAKGTYPQDAHPRAAYNSNKLLNTGFGKGDKPMRVYLEPTTFEGIDRRIDVIAFESAADLSPIEGELRVDVPRMTDTILVNPLKKILAAVGIDAAAAVRGQEQTGLGAFE